MGHPPEFNVKDNYPTQAKGWLEWGTRTPVMASSRARARSRVKIEPTLPLCYDASVWHYSAR